MGALGGMNGVGVGVGAQAGSRRNANRVASRLELRLKRVWDLTVQWLRYMKSGTMNLVNLLGEY